MIRRARSDGRETRENEEREERGLRKGGERIEKGSHCFFKSSGYEVGAQASKFGFFQVYRMHY